MNCDQFHHLTGMRCEPQPTHDGTPCVAVITPFRQFDGSGLSLFAFGQGAHVLLSDEGTTLAWLDGMGHALDDRRAWRPLRSAAQVHSVTLTDHGSFECLVPQERASVAFASMVAALLAVGDWARQGGTEPVHPLLLEEAALHLGALRPGVPLRREPPPVPGASGAHHSFALQHGDELIDVIGASKPATGAELRKLVDVRRLSANAALPLTVIIDDRRQPQHAQTEAAILSTFADAWMFSELLRRSPASPA